MNTHRCLNFVTDSSPLCQYWSYRDNMNTQLRKNTKHTRPQLRTQVRTRMHNISWCLGYRLSHDHHIDIIIGISYIMKVLMNIDRHLNWSMQRQVSFLLSIILLVNMELRRPTTRLCWRKWQTEKTDAFRQDRRLHISINWKNLFTLESKCVSNVCPLTRKSCCLPWLLIAFRPRWTNPCPIDSLLQFI